MLAGYRLGFHAVVCHEVPLCGAVVAHSALMWHGDVPHAPNRSTLWAHLDSNLNPIAWPRASELL
jgi:hypothetical protein